MAWGTPLTTSRASTNTSVTSLAINTTGYTFLAVLVTCQVGAAITFSDSKGNTWTALTIYDAASGGGRCRLYYCVAPVVGTGHTFTVTASFPAVVAMAFTGNAAVPFDTQNGAGFVGSGSPGSVTPSENNCLVLTGSAWNNANTPTISSPFSTPVGVVGSVNNYGAFAAYEIQTSLQARNPTWTISPSTGNNSANIAVFKAAPPAPVTASAALAVGAATLAASAEFDAPVYTATAALNAGPADLDASASFDEGTFSASASLLSPAAELAGSAEFDAPVYAAAASLAVGAAVLSGDALFAAEVYSGTADLSIGAASLAASASFVAPVYTASADLVAGAATLAADASFATATFTGTAALTVAAADLDASATFVAPAYTGEATLDVGAATLSGDAAFTGVTYAGSSSVTIGAAVFAGSVTIDSGSAGYNVYRRQLPTEPDVLITFVPAGDPEEWTVTGLAGSEQWFQVRAVSRCGVEDEEPLRLVRIAFDDAGNLILPTPNAPIGLRVECGAGGILTAYWSYFDNNEGDAPATFNVYAALDGSAFDFGTPTATVTASGARSFSSQLGPYTHGAVVHVIVRAEAATGAEEPNVNQASGIADAEAPDAATGLEVEVIAS